MMTIFFKRSARMYHMVASLTNDTRVALASRPGNLPGRGAAEPAAGGSVDGHQAAGRVPAAGGGRGGAQGAAAGLRGESRREAVDAREPPGPVAKVQKTTKHVLWMLYYVCDVLIKLLRWEAFFNTDCRKRVTSFTLYFIWTLITV